MGAFKVETCYGDVMVHNCYDYDTGESYYEAYEPTIYDEECCYGKYIGEFHSQYDYDDERELFIEDLENMLDDNDYVGVSSEPTPYTRQVSIIHKLEKLVHNRFSVESLEKKLPKSLVERKSILSWVILMLKMKLHPIGIICSQVSKM